MRKLLATLVIAASCLVAPAYALAPSTTRISVDTFGNQLTGQTSGVTMSANGRYLVFLNDSDLYFRDRWTNTVTKISTTPLSGLGIVSLSEDGRWITLTTTSSLVSKDTNGQADVYLFDRSGAAPTLISHDSSGNATGGENAVVSGDGNAIAFDTDADLAAGDANTVRDVYLWKRSTNALTRVSAGESGDTNNMSYLPSITRDGTVVSFSTDATNLTAAGSSTYRNIGVADMSGATVKYEYASVTSSGGQSSAMSDNSSISADGRYVAFVSSAFNLVPGDTNGVSDVFVRDRRLGTTTRVSVTPSGGNSDSGSRTPQISADGQSVAFFSFATNLVTPDTNGKGDIFTANLADGSLSRVSLSSAGNQLMDGAESLEGPGHISATGRLVAFISKDSGVAGGDTNGVADAFLHDTGINQRPKATLAATVSGQQATLTATATDPDGWIGSYEWDFGDGAKTTTVSGSATHTYAQPGTYVVTLQALDNDGEAGTATHVATITAPPPPSPVPTTAPPTASPTVGPPPPPTQAGPPKLVKVKLKPKTVRQARLKATLTITVDRAATVAISCGWRLGGGRRAHVKYEEKLTAAGTLRLPLKRVLSGQELPVGPHKLRVKATNESGQTKVVKRFIVRP